MTINIVLIDDHKMFRDGVGGLLARESGMKVIGQAEDGRKGVELVRKLMPHLVIMDVTMQNLNGIDATRRIQLENQKIKVIALSMHSHRRFVHDMLDAGASGYVLKECAFEELVHAIHTVYDHGQVYLSPEIARVVVQDYLQTNRESMNGSDYQLTPKEREVLQLIAEGGTNEKIARLLHLSTRTVEKHRSKIMDKLEIHGVAGLIKYAIREGLTDIDR